MSSYSMTISRFFHLTSTILSFFSIAAACAGLVAWTFKLPLLSSAMAVSPDLLLTVLLLGLALRVKLSRPSHFQFESCLYAAGAVAVAGVSLVFNLLPLYINSNYNFYLLNESLKNIFQEMPNAMPGDVACEAMAIGLCLVLAQAASPLLSRLGHLLALLSFTFALLSVGICGYASAGFYTASQSALMPPLPAFLFLFLSLACIFSTPEQGLSAILVSPGRAGTIARPLIAGAVAAPLAAGWLWLWGFKSGFFEAHFALAGLALTITCLGGMAIWHLCARIEQIDNKSQKAKIALQETIEQTRSTFASIFEAVITIDEDDRITEWNKQAERTFGWRQEQILGKTFAETLLPPGQQAAHKKALQSFIATGEGSIFNKQFELAALHLQGHVVPVELSISPIRAGESLRFFIFARDISERKRMSDELSKARDQALETSKLKSQFVANISHEIRTPLNAIVGLSDLLVRKQLSGEEREYVEMIHDSAETLLDIVNDILDYSKMEAGKLILEDNELNVLNLVEGAAELIAKEASKKGLSLSVFVAPDVPPALRGDPGRLRQVLLNLLANAVKFTQAGEVIVKVTVEDLDEGKAIIRFDVRDTGIGIEAESLSKSFQPFTQADSSVARKFGGTGLGLSISKRLVELMGGKIGAESRPSVGSDFWFSIPFERPPKRAQITPSKEVFHDVRLLLINGPSGGRETIAAYLSSWGINCLQADTGEEALNILKQEAFANVPIDLAIVDFQLTHSDALALAQSIRKYDDLKHTKLILVSTFDDGDFRAGAIKAGFDAHLVKPVKQSRLYDCIVNLISGKNVLIAGKNWQAHHEGQTTAADKNQGEEQSELDSKQKILIVEDNAVNQKVAKFQLAELGYFAEAVSNGCLALAALERADYALIFMDCQMPEMDGFEATRLIRQREALTGKHIPIIAMTAHAMSEDRYKCLSAGMDDYISKPVSRDRLKNIMERYAHDVPCALVPQPDLAIPSPVRSQFLPDNRPESQASGAGQETLALSDLCNCLGKEPAEEILSLFRKETTSSLDRLETAVSCQDFQTAGEIAHQLKGSCASVYAHEMAHLASDLQQVIKDENTDKIKAEIASLQTAFVRVTDLLNSQLPGAGSTV